ncbi:hypothetical protein WH47_12369 [Habropoda laboriosa]|uniref:Uncharacterized protein n=1 Tax=Habropoda laboriosa TaxID=597456 RepID=A0A0L7R7T6_9HYME|nr:hypothetical protein WH47_12369 [Habropoda laboriosa]
MLFLDTLGHKTLTNDDYSITLEKHSRERERGEKRKTMDRFKKRGLYGSAYDREFYFSALTEG